MAGRPWCPANLSSVFCWVNISPRPPKMTDCQHFALRFLTENNTKKCSQKEVTSHREKRKWFIYNPPVRMLRSSQSWRGALTRRCRQFVLIGWNIPNISSNESKTLCPNIRVYILSQKNEGGVVGWAQISETSNAVFAMKLRKFNSLLERREF